MATVSGYLRELKRLTNGVGLRVFGLRMGNDDYISHVVVAAVGQLEVESWLG